MRLCCARAQTLAHSEHRQAAGGALAHWLMTCADDTTFEGSHAEVFARMHAHTARQRTECTVKPFATFDAAVEKKDDGWTMACDDGTVAKGCTGEPLFAVPSSETHCLFKMVKAASAQPMDRPSPALPSSPSPRATSMPASR